MRKMARAGCGLALAIFAVGLAPKSVPGSLLLLGLSLFILFGG